MKVSELIKELVEALATHGDIPVGYFDHVQSYLIKQVIVATHRTGNEIWLTIK